jgi:hypothetical protein
MTTTVLRPNGSAPGPALADDSDATYTDPAPLVGVTMGTHTLAAGEIVLSMTVRLRSSGGTTRVFASSSANYSHDFYYNASATTDTGVTLAGSLTQKQINDLAFTLQAANSSPRIYELYVDLVTVTIPVVAVDTVTDPYTDSSNPQISWVNTLDSDGGDQTHYEVKVYTDAQYGAGGFDPDTSTPFLTTGIVASAKTFAYPGLFPDDTYRAYVRVAQTVNGARHWSAWDFDQFSVDVTPADVDTVTATAVDASGKITVTVARDTGTEAWEYIEVERSIDAGVTWSPVRLASGVDATGDADEFVVDDYEVPNGQAVVYRARATYYESGLKIRTVTGDWVESSSTSWTADDEWLKDPLSPSLNQTIQPYRWPGGSRSPNAGVFRVVGLSAPVVVSDVLSNTSGAITVRTEGQAEILALDALLADAGVLLLNLKSASLIGPNRDGFAYVAVTGTSEEWVTQYYLDNDEDLRLTTIEFVLTGTPPDATADSGVF